MLRSMYTGISGMRGFQTKLDVVSNDIANVNTFGYKKGRLTFSDMMSQTVSGATAPGNGLGGTNPKQVGLGVTTGSIDNIHTQGNVQTTNRPLDLAIEGDGMFVVGEYDGDFENISFTRAGNFYLDSEGYIVNPNGFYLMSSSGNRLNIPEEAQSFSIGSDGSISYVDDSGTVPVGTVGLAKFSNPGGLEKVGGNLYKYTENSGYIGNIDDIADGDGVSAPGQNGTGELVAGALEMSNVDLAEEFTEMITAQRGFQANTRIITTSDEILQELVNLKR